MKKLLISLIVLGLLISWMPMSAEAAAPTVTITPPSGTQTAAFDVTITFSENVTGFEEGDIGLTNGASVSLTGTGASYTATITPKVTGDIIISVAASVATNTGGEGNTAATAQTVTVDLPHSIMVKEPAAGPHSKAFDVMVMFTESVASSGAGAFTTDDITLTPSTLATVTEYHRKRADVYSDNHTGFWSRGRSEHPSSSRCRTRQCKYSHRLSGLKYGEWGGDRRGTSARLDYGTIWFTEQRLRCNDYFR